MTPSARPAPDALAARIVEIVRGAVHAADDCADNGEARDAALHLGDAEEKVADLLHDVMRAPVPAPELIGPHPIETARYALLVAEGVIRQCQCDAPGVKEKALGVIRLAVHDLCPRPAGDNGVRESATPTDATAPTAKPASTADAARARELADEIVRDVCELPGYDSPEDDPELLTVREPQLRAIVENVLDRCFPAPLDRDTLAEARTAYEKQRAAWQFVVMNGHRVAAAVNGYSGKADVTVLIDAADAVLAALRGQAGTTPEEGTRDE